MATDKIIVALDYDDPATALNLVHRVRGDLTCFKVGSQLFTRGGPDFVRELRRLDLEIFLDLKFHDIPATVGKAVRAAVALDVRFITVHAGGGAEMLRAAVAAASGSTAQILGVTVLTSMDDAALSEIGFSQNVAAQVIYLAQLATRVGVTGLVCSPWEIALIKKEISTPLTLVTPGIRSGTEDCQDQKRTLSAREALQLGASHLVIGRPITQAADPAAAARKLCQEIGF